MSMSFDADKDATEFRASPVTDSPPPVSVPEITNRHRNVANAFLRGIRNREYTEGDKKPESEAREDICYIVTLLASGDYKLIRTEELENVKSHLLTELRRPSFSKDAPLFTEFRILANKLDLVAQALAVILDEGNTK